MIYKVQLTDEAKLYLRGIYDVYRILSVGANDCKECEKPDCVRPKIAQQNAGKV